MACFFYHLGIAVCFAAIVCVPPVYMIPAFVVGGMIACLLDIAFARK